MRMNCKWIIERLSLSFWWKIRKNDFYSKQLINEGVQFNNILISNNIHNKIVNFNTIKDLNSLKLIFSVEKNDPVIINKINIAGNSIIKIKL